MAIAGVMSDVNATEYEVERGLPLRKGKWLEWAFGCWRNDT